MSAAASTSVRPTSPAMVGSTELPAHATEKLSRYLDLLAKWNRTYNLTAIRERSQMITHHLHDSLAVVPWLPARRGIRVLDVGTGAGLPGIPLAVARPDSTFVLLDANHKKIAFVTQAAIELSLDNVRPVPARVEDFVSEQPFDVVISRAFSDLATFARLASPLVVPDGILIAMKGARATAEIASLSPNIAIVETPELDVAGLDAKRQLVVMRVVAGARQ